jgi:hypothetical protein
MTPLTVTAFSFAVLAVAVAIAVVLATGLMESLLALAEGAMPW